MWSMTPCCANEMQQDTLCARCKMRLAAPHNAILVMQSTAFEHLGTRPKTERLRQSKSYNALEDLQKMPVSSAKDIIDQAGYPLEQWSVITPDGYVLVMERIPRKGACNGMSFSAERALILLLNGSVSS